MLIEHERFKVEKPKNDTFISEGNGLISICIFDICTDLITCCCVVC